jgi:hypothetical protein
MDTSATTPVSDIVISPHQYKTKILTSVAFDRRSLSDEFDADKKKLFGLMQSVQL